LGGSFLHFWLNLAVTSFTFRTRSAYGINVIWGTVTAFLAGLIVPVAFYPEALQDFILWTPFPTVANIPIRVLMGDTVVTGGLALVYRNLLHVPPTAAFIMEQFSWILVVLPTASRLYRWNEKSADIQGG
jgi:ABC-2 type transport system permease protein